MSSNKHILFKVLLITLFLSFMTSSSAVKAAIPVPADTIPLPAGKEIYIPKEFRDMNFFNPESRWSYHRMACTDNFVIFWEKGFGKDLACAPDLEGKPMQVDLKNLEEKLEAYYRVFKEDMEFILPGSKADRYRMMVMINYSLEGTAYGGDYDGEIGALWVTPNRLQDRKLNCIAHELGHSFQSQVTCDGAGEAWGGCGFFEMASQWMLWNVNPDWLTDEQYHWDAFCKNTHKAFLHLSNIYRSPYVLQYWSEKHGKKVIGELFRQGKKGEDPVMTYKRMSGLSQEAFNDEMFDAQRRLVNLDFKHAYQETRRHAGKLAFPAKVQPHSDKLACPAEVCPENYGCNAIPLQVPTKKGKVAVSFEGLADALKDAKETTDTKGYQLIHPEKAGWRLGFVAIDTEGKAHYSDACSVHGHRKAKLSYQLPEGKTFSQLWLVVMAAPTEHWKNEENWEHPELVKDAQWPYSIKLKHTEILK